MFNINCNPVVVDEVVKSKIASQTFHMKIPLAVHCYGD